MKTTSNYVEDWENPPTTEEQLDCWRIYTVIWKELDLTPPAYYIRRWLLTYGLPSSSSTVGHNPLYQRAVDTFMYPGKERRHP